jgi:RepB plasmid partitioning protein/ParB-like nuclease domain
VNASTNVGFELRTVLLPIGSITTRGTLTTEVRKSRKYKQIAASIAYLGLVEPLVVSRVGDGKFLLLDGAIRLDVLIERKELEVRCILSTDDEGYTYNKRVNQLSNIGEHYMILKALSNGVSEQDISVSLSVDVETIRRKRSMLDGICKEVVELLTNRRVAVQTYGILRKMKPIGQIQAAERMIHANAYSTRMARALLTITKPELLVAPEKVSRSSPGSGGKLEVLQQESEALLTDLKKVEESYATQALDLTLGLGYVERLLANARIAKYLAKHHADLLNEFTKLLGEKAEEMSRTILDPVKISPRGSRSSTKKGAKIA